MGGSLWEPPDFFLWGNVDMLNPLFYGFLMTGIVVSIVLLILTLERVYLRVKHSVERGARGSVLSPATEIVDRHPEG